MKTEDQHLERIEPEDEVVLTASEILRRLAQYGLTELDLDDMLRKSPEYLEVLRKIASSLGTREDVNRPDGSDPTTW